MADTVAVKPASADARQSHPFAGPLPAAGGFWPADQFTFRRLRDGDLVRLSDAEVHALVETAPADPAAAPAEPAPEPAEPSAKSPAAALAAKAVKDNA